MSKFSPIFAFALLIASCSSASAQSKDTTKPAAVTSLRQANDSTGLLTFKDFIDLNTTILQELPAKYANPITQWLQQRYQLRATEYATKPVTKH
jgi:hypothetical protein